MNTRTRALTVIAKERWRISLLLTILMMIIYFGFILLIAFNKSLLATLITPGLSLGILLGALVIVSAWVLIYVYVHWANTYYDKQIAQFQNEDQQ